MLWVRFTLPLTSPPLERCLLFPLPRLPLPARPEEGSKRARPARRLVVCVDQRKCLVYLVHSIRPVQSCNPFLVSANPFPSSPYTTRMLTFYRVLVLIWSR